MSRSNVFKRDADNWKSAGEHAAQHRAMEADKSLISDAALSAQLAGLGVGSYHVVCSVPSSVTGTTAQTALGIVTIPPSKLAPNCRIKVEALFSANSSNNNRTIQVLVNEAGAGLISADAFYNAGSGSSNYGSWNVSASLYVKSDMSSQIGGLLNSYPGIGVVLSPPEVFNHNASNGLDIVFAATNGSPSDHTTLEAFVVEVQK